MSYHLILGAIMAGFTAGGSGGGGGGGGGDPTFSFDGLYASDFEVAPTNAVAEFTFKRTGMMDGQGNITYPSGNWIAPYDATVGDDYEIEFHLNGGDAWTSGAAADTWLALTSDRTIGVTDSTGIGISSSVRVRIRRVSDSVVVAEGSIGLSASKFV